MQKCTTSAASNPNPLTMIHLHPYQYIQLLSLLVAILCYGGLSKYRITLFVPLLVIVNLVEITGVNFKMLGWVPWLNNHAIYNYNLLLETPVRLFLLGRMLLLKTNERHTFTGIIFLCMLAILLNYLFLQGPVAFNEFSLILIQFLTILLSCFVLLRLALREAVQPALWKDPYFWISAGYLLFSLMTLVLLGLQSYIQANHVTLGGKSLYKAMMPVPNFVLYLTLSYAFILCMIRKDR